MALLKSENTQYGIDATYWNIFSIYNDFKNKRLEVVVVGYASKEVRDENLSPVVWNNLTFDGNDYIQDATRALLYPVLKAKYFSDAQDC